MCSGSGEAAATSSAPGACRSPSACAAAAKREPTIPMRTVMVNQKPCENDSIIRTAVGDSLPLELIVTGCRIVNGFGTDTRMSSSTTNGKRVETELDETTYRIIGAAMAVHNKLGPGLKEAIYHNAMVVELERAGLPAEDEKAMEVVIDESRVGLLYMD